ncbi:MAG: TonB-dependent receptor [Sinobacteraceae bacterium]|nr:TonB-dependent receptor [Nevskiaceae bacterium]
MIRRVSGLLAALAVVPVLQHAYAADEAPPPPGAALEEVTVTAQKRVQNAQDVGISISAVSGADLQALGAVEATDITKSMPAVVLTQPNGPSSFSLSIRGVTQNDFADHQESPAAIYIDDVYVSQMAGLAFSLFDMERVEVLRGPQGTLFGRNATGGLANFITRKPGDQQEGYIDVTFGERNLVRVEGAFNSPLTDSIDARLAFESNHYDPLFHNLSGGAPDAENGNDWALRGEMLFKLPAAAQLLMTGRFARQDVHAGSWEERPIYNVAPGVDDFIPADANPYGTCNGCNASGLPASGPFTTRDNRAGYAKIKTSGVTGKYTQDLSGATLTVIADYSGLQKDYQEDSDASPLTLFEFFNGSKVNQQSLEARLNGGDQRFNWTAGLYGLRIHGDYYEGYYGPAFFSAQEFNTPGNPNNACFPPAGAWPYGDCTAYYRTGGVPGPDGGVPGIRSPYSQLTKSYAAFGQVEYRLTDLIGLTLGARVTRDQKDYHFSWYPFESFPSSPTGAVSILTPFAIPGVGNDLFDYRNSLSDTLVSGKAQVDFHISSDLLTYVSVNRGVKGGGFTAPLFPDTISDTGPLRFSPEKLTSYEAGFKSEFWDHTLRFNGAAYYYDYHDYQALIYTVALEQLIVNANAKHKGAEFDLEWVPNASWRFALGGSYVDAVVENVDSRGTGVPGNYTAPNAPRWSANALARYNLPLGPGQLSMQLDGNYLTHFWFNLANTPVVEQGGFGVGNVRLFWTPTGGKYEVGTSVENVFNKHYGVMGFDNTGINGLAQIYPGNPRWWKAHITYHF